jgi:uncharacterized membrane protein YqjE
MPDDRPLEGSSQGIVATASRLLAQLVSAAETRLGILATELDEERIRLGRLLLLGSVTLFCLGLGIVLLAVFFVVLYWETNRLAVLGLLSGLFLGLGLVCAIALRVIARGRKPPLRETVEVLAKDRAALEPHR